MHAILYLNELLKEIELNNEKTCKKSKKSTNTSSSSLLKK